MFTKVDEDHVFAFSRNDTLIVLTNLLKGELKQKVAVSPFLPNDTVCNYFDHDDCVKVASDGSLRIQLNATNGTMYKIYVPKAKLNAMSRQDDQLFLVDSQLGSSYKCDESLMMAAALISVVGIGVACTLIHKKKQVEDLSNAKFQAL